MQPIRDGELHNAVTAAFASVEAAVDSVTRADYEAAMDDLLAARLVLTTLIASGRVD